jgi:hypothetical protein
MDGMRSSDGHETSHSPFRGGMALPSMEIFMF